jgi:hypothetical protein
LRACPSGCREGRSRVIPQPSSGVSASTMQPTTTGRPIQAVARVAALISTCCGAVREWAAPLHFTAFPALSSRSGTSDTFAVDRVQRPGPRGYARRRRTQRGHRPHLPGHGHHRHPPTRHRRPSRRVLRPPHARRRRRPARALERTGACRVRPPPRRLLPRMRRHVPPRARRDDHAHARACAASCRRASSWRWPSGRKLRHRPADDDSGPSDEDHVEAALRRGLKVVP